MRSWAPCLSSGCSVPGPGLWGFTLTREPDPLGRPWEPAPPLPPTYRRGNWGQIFTYGATNPGFKPTAALTPRG